jgi:hypothetical protein
MRRSGLLVISLFVLAAFAQSPAPAADPFAALRFLIGDWVADSASGGGSGWFSFSSDLGGKVLIRRNHSENPPQSGRTPVHDDLMVIYPDGSTLHADFYDSEGHVIHYAVSSPSPGSAVFVSAAQPGAPRFRLTYKAAAADKIDLVFDIAPAGQPEFRNYITASAHRKR